MTAGDREQAGQLELEAGTHISAMSTRRESKLAVVWGSKLSKPAPTGTLPPTRPHLLSLLEQHHQLGSSIQIHEIRGTFLNQATTLPILCSYPIITPITPKSYPTIISESFICICVCVHIYIHIYVRNFPNPNSAYTKITMSRTKG